jgi:hypothetical protein
MYHTSCDAYRKALDNYKALLGLNLVLLKMLLLVVQLSLAVR